VKYYGEMPLDNEYTLKNDERQKCTTGLAPEWVLMGEAVNGAGKGNRHG
jgi:hypothetical protein